MALNELEFRRMLTKLRLAELFTATAGVFQYQAYSSERFVCPTYICDYNRQRCRARRLVLGGGEERGRDQRLGSPHPYAVGREVSLASAGSGRHH